MTETATMMPCHSHQLGVSVAGDGVLGYAARMEGTLLLTHALSPVNQSDTSQCP